VPGCNRCRLNNAIGHTQAHFAKLHAQASPEQWRFNKVMLHEVLLA